MPGITVRFALAGTGGSITGAEQVSDAAGIAELGTWRAGLTTGTYTVTAEVVGLSPVTFSLSVSPQTPVQLETLGSIVRVASPTSAAYGLEVRLPITDAPVANQVSVEVLPLPVNLPAGYPPTGPMFRISRQGGTPDSLVMVKVPVPGGAAANTGIAIRNPATGVLSPVRVISEDANSITIITLRMSPQTESGLAGLFGGGGYALTTPEALELLIYRTSLPRGVSGFDPALDGWDFENVSTLQNTGFFSVTSTDGGVCSGWSMGAIWYYLNEVGRSGIRARQRTSSAWPSRGGIVGQSEVLSPAFRFASAVHASDSWSQWQGAFFRANRSDSLFIGRVAEAIRISGNPVAIGLYRPDGGHAVIAYAADFASRTIDVLDPNFPSTPSQIRMEPDGSLIYDFSDNPASQPVPYRSFDFIPTADFPVSLMSSIGALWTTFEQDPISAYRCGPGNGSKCFADYQLKVQGAGAALLVSQSVSVSGNVIQVSVEGLPTQGVFHVFVRGRSGRLISSFPSLTADLPPCENTIGTVQPCLALGSNEVMLRLYQAQGSDVYHTDVRRFLITRISPIGTVDGTVTSPQRGVLSGVTVSAGNITTTTSGTGTYTLANVPVGPTTVTLSTLPSGCTNPGGKLATVPFGASTTVDFTVTCTPIPVVLSKVSGDPQQGPVGTPLPAPLVVEVTRSGVPVAGELITFAPGVGSGTVTSAHPTDASGRTQVSWTLGPAVGSQVVTASVDGGIGSPVTFSAIATPLPGSSGPLVNWMSSTVSDMMDRFVRFGVDAAGTIMASGFSGQIWTSRDKGASWSRLRIGNNVVFALDVIGQDDFWTANDITIIRMRNGQVVSQATAGGFRMVEIAAFGDTAYIAGSGLLKVVGNNVVMRIDDARLGGVAGVRQDDLTLWAFDGSGGVFGWDGSQLRLELTRPGTRWVDGWVAPDETVFLVGFTDETSGVIASRKGGTWSFSTTSYRPDQIHGLTSAEVVVASWGVRGGADVYRYDGTTWTRLPTPPICGQAAGISAVRPGEYWLASGAGVQRYLNGTWEVIHVTPRFISASVASEQAAFLVGDMTNILRWNGNTWELFGHSPYLMNYSVLALGDNEVLVSGSDGVAHLVNGTVVRNWPSAGQYLLDKLLLASGPRGVIAAGNGGRVIYRLSGSAWIAETFTTDHLMAIHVAADGSEWASGMRGTLLMNTGTGWVPWSSPNSQDLLSMWGTGASDLFVSDRRGEVFRFDGLAWNRILGNGTGFSYLPAHGFSVTPLEGYIAQVGISRFVPPSSVFPVAAETLPPWVGAEGWNFSFQVFAGLSGRLALAAGDFGRVMLGSSTLLGPGASIRANWNTLRAGYRGASWACY